MIIDELLALLRLDKLKINKMSFFYSITYYPENRLSGKSFHIFLYWPQFFYSWQWKIEDAGTNSILFTGKKCKELYDELEIHRKMSERDRKEKARETIAQVLSGELDKIINNME